MRIPFPEPWEFAKDLRFTFYLWRLQTPLYDDSQDIKTRTVEWNSTTSKCIFPKLAVKNVNVNVVKPIYCQRNLIFLAKKNYSIHYLTGQNRGLSGLKNIWLVIMTGDLLFVIFSPGTCIGICRTSVNLSHQIMLHCKLTQATYFIFLFY